MKAIYALVFVCTIVLAAAGCSKEQTTAEPENQHEEVILTTFYPMTYFARRIAGDFVPVECLVPEGEDPIFWRPSREALQRYASAKLVVLNGAGFEKWTQQATLPASRVVDTNAGSEAMFLRYESGVSHSHGPGGEHSHTGTDGHTWLGDDTLAKQISNLTDAMIQAWPVHEAAFSANAAMLTQDLANLNRRLQDEVSGNLDGIKLLASHPAYNYLARSSGWMITNLDLDPAEGLSDEAIAKINEAIGDHEGKVILLWEAEPAIDRSIEYPFQNVMFSPAELPVTGTEAASPDYIGIMNANIDRLVEAIKK